MRLIEYKDKSSNKNYIILVYEPWVHISVGDEYAVKINNELMIRKCVDIKNSDELNNGVHRSGKDQSMFKDLNLHSYKIHSKIEVDDEGYAKFYITYTPESESVMDCEFITVWRADQDIKPVNKNGYWVCGESGYTKDHQHWSRPDGAIIEDRSIIDDLEFRDPNTIGEVELNVIDWFGFTDYDIRGTIK